jgi:RNA-directed DNA polymerase
MVGRSERIRRSGAPVLFTLKHLALASDVDFGYLKGVVRRGFSPYRTFRIGKKGGGKREIQAPSDELAKVQRWILHEILDGTVRRHVNNFAYFPKSTARECAERHSGATWMIKADIHNYFPSIGEKAVFKVFRELGYSRLLSFELSRLCTWPTLQSKRSHRLIAGMPYNKPDSQGVLPQGAPTSGALANAATLRLDDTLSSFALRKNLVYTRYSDDMVFSSSTLFDRDLAQTFIAEVRKIVTSAGLQLHRRKTKVIPPGARQIVLGMLITETGPRILPEQKRRIGLYVHAVDKFGPVNFASKRNFDSVISFINHVEGWFAYLSYIDSAWTQMMRAKWLSALEKHDIALSSLG